MQAGTFFSPTYLFSTDWVISNINCKNRQGRKSTYACMYVRTHAHMHTGTASMERSLGLYIHSLNASFLSNLILLEDKSA